MQLGVRWRAGEAPHRSVPEELHERIAAQEALFPQAHSWTLTWLEGRPRCALDHVVVVTPDGVERVGPGPGIGSGTDGSSDADDDWLK